MKNKSYIAHLKPDSANRESRFMKMWRRSFIVKAALIVLITVLAYLPAMRGGFVFDDTLLITHNRLIRASDGLYRFWLTTEADEYYPLTGSLRWLEWRLWSNDATGYHVVNVLLHAVNGVLVWMILRRLKIPGAWLAALVFAIHPVNVASVAWVSEQKNTMSMLFYAAAILSYLRFDEEERWRWYTLSLGAFVLALLSKNAVVMLPVVLLGCRWWTHGKLRWKDVLRAMPFFALSLAFGLLNIWFEQRALRGPSIQTVGFASRLAAAGWVLWFYLYKALLPFDLMAVYPKWNIQAFQWLSYLPGAIVISSLTLFWLKRGTWGRPLLFALGYFVVMLFPVLGFFDIVFYAFSLVADHWQYYSIIGVIALVVAAGERICRRMGERGRYIGVSIGAIVLVVLGSATWKRSCVYADSETLWRDNLAKNPNAWVAHNYLGVDLLRTARIPEAIVHFEQALRLKPDYEHARDNLGNAFMQLGRIQDAIGQYEQALRIDPDSATAHYNLGVALVQAGNLQSATAHFEQAVRIEPDYAEAHNNLGSALLIAGRTEEAITHYEQALRQQPASPVFHCNLAMALEQAGNVKQARAEYEQALRLKPEYTDARNGLARLRTGPS